MHLLADIGGTHARFAWQEAAGAPMLDVRTLAVAAHASLADAVRHYLATGAHPVPHAAAMAIAAPITGDAVEMTNAPWAFSIAAMQAELGLARLVLLNDFTALALGLPSLAADGLLHLPGSGAGPHPARGVCGVIGAGTGLGVSGLIPSEQGGWQALAGLGGHVGLTATTAREWAVTQWLAVRFGRASAERALSGQGLENLYVALQELDGITAEPLAAAQVLASAAPHAVEARALFCGWLGDVAGDLMLTLGAVGGIYITGGIVPRMQAEFVQSAFLARFQAKGRFAAYVAATPVWLVTAAQSPALLGAATALARP